MTEGGTSIRKWNRVTGYVLLVVGGVTLWGAAQLSMGTLKHPGSGFFPFLLGVVLVVFSIVLVFQHWEKDKVPQPFWPARAWVRPLLGVAILGFYALLVDLGGFLVTTFVFLVIWMAVIERLRWRTILSISIGTTVALYLIFSLFLEVPLPQGFLGI